MRRHRVTVRGMVDLDSVVAVFECQVPNPIPGYGYATLGTTIAVCWGNLEESNLGPWGLMCYELDRVMRGSMSDAAIDAAIVLDLQVQP